jgi:hypothetical protein
MPVEAWIGRWTAVQSAASALWLAHAMPYRPLRDAYSHDLLVDFGRIVRAGRRRASVSQSRLESLSGVDQVAISRLELARAPAMRVIQLVRLGAVLGRNMPLGFCPHDHACVWQPPPLLRPASTSGLVKPRTVWDVWDRVASSPDGGGSDQA